LTGLRPAAADSTLYIASDRNRSLDPPRPGTPAESSKVTRLRLRARPRPIVPICTVLLAIRRLLPENRRE
jgi:hypothetical protein